MEKINIIIGNKEFNVLVAETDTDKENGLSNIKEMDPDEGMLFDYSESPVKEISFWMHDTDIPLDIIFIGTDNIVISVNKGVPNTDDYITETNGPIAYVLEVNEKSGINKGDELEILDDNSSYSSLEPNKMLIIDSNGKSQFEIKGGERIVSRIETKVLIKKAKKAFLSKKDADYKDLGRYVFNVFKKQDNRPADYVETKKEN